MLVKNLAGQTEMLTDIKSLRLKKRVNGEYSLSFLLLKTERNEHSYPLAIEESLLEYEGQKYRIKGMEERPVGLSAIKQIKADHIFFDLIDEYQYDTLTGYLSITETLIHALTGTGYTWEVIGAFSQYQTENFGDDNCLALVQKILDRYGAEVDIDNKHLVFRNQIGRKTDFQFRFKHNLKAISKSVDTSNLSTYIKGYGAEGVSSEYLSPNWTKYGKRHAKPVRDERYTTKEGLLERLKRDVQDEPKINFTVDFVDLRDQGYPYDRPHKGEEVYVIYEPLDIDITARILEIDELKDAHGNIIKTNVTLANFKNSATDILSSFSRTQKQVDGILEGKEKLPMAALDAAVQRATEIIKNTESEIEYPESGWLIFRDKKDPNKVVVLNSSGLAISNNNLVNVLSAITGDGIVADRITTGKLNARNVEIINLTIGPQTSFASGYDPTKKVETGVKFDNSIVIGNGNGIKVKDASNIDRVMMGQYAAGKYGLKVTNGEIFGTMIRSGSENSTSYLEIRDSSDFPLKLITNNKESITFGRYNRGGSIQILDHVNDNLVGQINGGSRDGLHIESRGWTLPYKPFYIDTSHLDINGDTSVQGDFQQSGGTTVLNKLMVMGHKDAIQLTDSFGYVHFAARESPETKFIDEGKNKLMNGVCKITLDDMFLESVEANEDFNWLVQLTPYSPIQPYVDEIGDNYFIVKELNGKSGEFVWSLSATRRGFTERFRTSDLSALHDNWEDEILNGGEVENA